MGSDSRDDRRDPEPTGVVQAVDELIELLSRLKHALPRIESIDRRLAELEVEAEKFERARRQFYLEISEMRGNSEMLSILLSGAKDLKDIRRIGTRVLSDAIGGLPGQDPRPQEFTDEQDQRASS